MKIALIGKAGCGKTTLAIFLVNTYGYNRLSFATPIKKLAQSVIFWRPLDKKKDRAFLQAFGDGARNSDKTVWIRWLEWDLRTLEDVPPLFEKNIVLDDCRYLNEAQFLRDNGFILVRLRGKGYDLKGKRGSHVSEVDLDNYEADYELDSTGSMSYLLEQFVKLLVKLKTGK